MNASDTKRVVDWYKEDVARLTGAIAKTQAECTHVFDNGATALRRETVYGIPGSVQIMDICQGCGALLVPLGLDSTASPP